MARGRNGGGNGRQLDVRRPHHQQEYDMSNQRESLKGCPVGQPANDAPNDVERNDRDALIAKHRQDTRDGKHDSIAVDNGLQGGTTGMVFETDPSFGATRAGPVHHNDHNFKRPSLQVASTFGSAVSKASHVSHVHEDCPMDVVDGFGCDGSDQPIGGQETTRRNTASSNQYNTRNLNTERDRLSTYFDWPGGVPVTPEELAREGFFYCGVRDRVECAFCGGELHQWEQGDDPFTEHSRHYPHCPFVKGEATANVPLGATFQQTTPSTRTATTTHSSHTPSAPRPVTVEPPTTGTGNTSSAFALPPGTEWPKRPDMADEHMRLSTYHNWPMYSPVSPIRLARAGFLHTYVADQVRCYWCDGGLKDWQQDDDPWEEHARWYGPECGYVILNKGMDYIRDIRRRRPPILQQPQYQWGMETSIIQSALDMGFTEDRVQAVVQRQWQRHNRPFRTAAELINALLPQEEVQFYPAANEEEEPSFTFQTAPAVLPAPAPRLTPPVDEQPLDPETMERELRQLREERQCKVCLSEDACMVFIPCGHLCCCEHCANMLRVRGRRCPLCRALFQRVQRAFLA